jgi:L-malate glycosyltransferase
MLQGWVPAYRVPFFEGVREALRSRGIEFRLLYGDPVGEDAAKRSAVRLEWATHVAARVLSIGSVDLTLQKVRTHVRGSDLVICEQASSQLTNYALLATSKLRGRYKFAFWGHGRSYQPGRASRLGETVKRNLACRVDWWFAYNDRTVDYLKGLGYPAHRITNFQNAVDTSALARAHQAVSGDDLRQLRTQLHLGAGPVGIYVGGMYREKRLPFLLRACDELRRLRPDFSMLFIGDGPERPLIEAFVRERSWAQHLGVLMGTEKVPYMATADVHLMPGLVGLTVLDSFAVGLPLVTIVDSEHSPEIAYLEDGMNGLILPAGTSPEAYARAVVGMLEDRTIRERLVAGCMEARANYTIEEMVARFVLGVEQALHASPWHPRDLKMAGR